MSKIVVYTLAGTDSGLNGSPGPFDFDDPLGCYPQKIGHRLQNYNPEIYEWFPVDYTPYLILTDGRPLIEMSDTAVGIVTSDVLSRPAGTKFVLSGLSQGTLSVGRLYNEFRFGTLQARRNDLVGIINFGDGLRPAGWTVPFPGAVDPGGSGVIGNALVRQSYGSVPGVIANPDPFYLSFNQPGDVAGCANLTGLARDAMNWLAERALYGISLPGVIGNRIAGGGLDGIGELFVTMFDELRELAKFSVLTVSEWADIVSAIGAALTHWLGMGAAAVAGLLNSVVPGAGTFVANLLDPHQQYDLNPLGVPWPYRGIPNNSKSAVQLGFEWARDNLTPLVEPPVSQFYVNSSKPKPTFYYANGTAFGWNVNGVVIGDMGGAPRYIRGLDGPVLWNGGGIPYDPFPKLLDAGLWQYKRVQYPAQAILAGLSIEAGVDWVIDQIKQTPVGTPFAIGGYSQGAAVASRVYNECRQGRLADRRADLRAAVAFGNPMREQGHTFPTSSGYSGAANIAGDTRTGHGAFPQWDEDDFFGLLTSPFIQRFARLKKTEDLFWDFTMPNEIVSGVSSSTNEGKFFQNVVADGLRQVPIGALLGVFLLEQLGEWGSAPPGVPTNGDGLVRVVDALSGEVDYLGGGGHIMYPFYPPPNSDGSIPTSGDTCYQIAAKYLNTVGARIYDERNPTVVAPMTRAAYSWFTSLPAG